MSSSSPTSTPMPVVSQGNLVYVGRKDDQVKIRGLRIELGEIESVINTAPNVVQSSVILVHSDRGEKKIAAYVRGDTSIGKLREYMLSILPSHMIPHHFIFVNSLPMTPNGKVDKKQLEARKLAHTKDRTGPQPSTPTEVELAKIWETILDIDSVSTVDNFFELGGDSLLAVGSAQSIKERFGVEPDLKLLMLGTLKDLANHIDELLDKRNTSWLGRLRNVLRQK